jgi:hypothetical protein
MAVHSSLLGRGLFIRGFAGYGSGRTRVADWAVLRLVEGASDPVLQHDPVPPSASVGQWTQGLPVNVLHLLAIT